MEQHAVPQDITGFKFKLVGDMTLKQFGELAFGAIVAYLFFASGLHPIIKWPFVIFFAFFGIALAFLPIQERPLDTWIINFFKAIYKPTYFTWRKNTHVDNVKPPEVASGFVPMTAHVSNTPLMAADNVTSAPANQNAIANLQPMTPIQNSDDKNEPAANPEQEADKQTEPQLVPEIKQSSFPTASPSMVSDTQNQTTINNQTTVVPSGALSIEELLKQRQQQAPPNVHDEKQAMTIEDLMKQREQTSQSLNEKSADDLSNAEEKLSSLSQKNNDLMLKVDLLREQIYKISNAGGDASKLQPELEKLITEKAEVYDQVGKARDEVIVQKVAPLATPAYMEPTRNPLAPARPKPQPPKPIDLTTIPLTSSPNVVNGIVVSTSGIPIDGVIITVKDNLGNSIRALRTSKLGQFIASTPLSAGEYYLELEKTGFEFDVWKIILDGSVLAPVRIIAREQDGHN